MNKGTVSRALRGSYGVAPLTRKRILEVAARMQFSASPLASALASRAVPEDGRHRHPYA